jgi:uncharacterized protein
MSITVTALATTAVKGTRVREVAEIELGPRGAHGDRMFFVIDERGQMMNGKNVKTLQTAVADYDRAASTLALSFPDGTVAAGELAYGDTITTRFFSRPKEARELTGPWSDALSVFFGQSLRLVATESAVDRGRKGAISVISRASLARLAEVAARDRIDPRRFRMLIEIDGVAAHEEDAWLGRRVRVGAALVKPHGHVGRCVITTRDPDTAHGDLDTLKLLATYRHKIDTTEPLAFGIHGEVLEGGTVRVGDPVVVED